MISPPFSPRRKLGDSPRLSRGEMARRAARCEIARTYSRVIELVFSNISSILIGNMMGREPQKQGGG